MAACWIAARVSATDSSGVAAGLMLASAILSLLMIDRRDSGGGSGIVNPYKR
jgi:hypothetical protein